MFLRSGWIVGQAGVLGGVLIVVATGNIQHSSYSIVQLHSLVFTALVSVLAAVGICERCRMESGGVYFLLSQVLGSRFGGSLGLLYCFGQVKFLLFLSSLIY